MLNVLRRRDFALLWFGGLISLLGDWALIAALPVYVYGLTGSTLATGGMVAVLVMPRVLLGSVAGVFVDRWDRRRTLVWANVLLALNVLLLAAVSAPEHLWIVFVVAFIQSSLAQLVQPAEGALLPLLVPDSERVPANALNALNNNAARLIGPSIGGLVVGYVGIGGVAVLDAASFLIAAGLIALIAAEAGARPADAASDGSVRPAATVRIGVWEQWRDGLKLVGRSRPLATIFLFMAITGLGEGVMGALFAAFVMDVLRESELAYGWLLSAQAVGGLVGGVVVARWGARVAPARLIGVGGIAISICDLMIFNSQLIMPGLLIPLAAMVVVGVPFSAQNVGRMTLLQASTEDRQRGRVIGALGATLALSVLIGSLVGGLLGGPVGIVTMLNVQGGGYALAGIMVLVRLRSSRSAIGATADTSAARSP